MLTRWRALASLLLLLLALGQVRYGLAEAEFLGDRAASQWTMLDIVRESVVESPVRVLALGLLDEVRQVATVVGADGKIVKPVNGGSQRTLALPYYWAALAMKAFASW